MLPYVLAGVGISVFWCLDKISIARITGLPLYAYVNLYHALFYYHTGKHTKWDSHTHVATWIRIYIRFCPEYQPCPPKTELICTNKYESCGAHVSNHLVKAETSFPSDRCYATICSFHEPSENYIERRWCDVFVRFPPVEASIDFCFFNSQYLSKLCRWNIRCKLLERCALAHKTAMCTVKISQIIARNCSGKWLVHHWVNHIMDRMEYEMLCVDN